MQNKNITLISAMFLLLIEHAIRR